MDPTMNPELAVNPILTGVIGLFGLGALICWILVIVAAFKKEEKPLMGILSIVLCSLGGFIIGWVHSKKWAIQKVMIIWTILVVVILGLYAMVIASVSAAVADQMQLESFEVEAMEAPALEAPALESAPLAPEP